jgi:hypothetical protein
VVDREFPLHLVQVIFLNWHKFTCFFIPHAVFSPTHKRAFPLFNREKGARGGNRGRKGQTRTKKLKLFSIYDWQHFNNLKMNIFVQLMKLFISEFPMSSYLNLFCSYLPSKYPNYIALRSVPKLRARWKTYISPDQKNIKKTIIIVLPMMATARKIVAFRRKLDFRELREKRLFP